MSENVWGLYGYLSQQSTVTFPYSLRPIANERERVAMRRACTFIYLTKLPPVSWSSARARDGQDARRANAQPNNDGGGSALVGRMN